MTNGRPALPARRLLRTLLALLLAGATASGCSLPTAVSDGQDGSALRESVANRGSRVNHDRILWWAIRERRER